MITDDSIDFFNNRLTIDINDIKNLKPEQRDRVEIGRAHV